MLDRFLICLVIWAFVCSVTAIPSFVASMEYSDVGRILGIAFWVVVYATITSTAGFTSKWRLPYVRQAIIITYSMRMLISLPALISPMYGLFDLIGGRISIEMGQSLYRTVLRDADSLHGVTCTTIITIIHGGQLSVLTFLVLLVVLPICESRYLKKLKYASRGFDVLPVDPQPVSAASGSTSASQSANDRT